jgi:hypothetical protein
LEINIIDTGLDECGLQIAELKDLRYGIKNKRFWILDKKIKGFVMWELKSQI